MYYAAISATLTKAAFTILAKDLARRSTDAGAYLTWLIYRGWRWPTVAAAKVMRCLELFSGSGSIRRAFERIGWAVVSLDIDPKCNPTHVADVLSWDYHAYPRDHFDFVWASPVCQHYSVARTTGGPRDLLSADRLVRRTLDIMNYFECNWAFENHQSGLLKTRSRLVGGLPFFHTSYCRYDNWEYRKTTRIWSSLALCL